MLILLEAMYYITIACDLIAFQAVCVMNTARKNLRCMAWHRMCAWWWEYVSTRCGGDGGAGWDEREGGKDARIR